VRVIRASKIRPVGGEKNERALEDFTLGKSGIRFALFVMPRLNSNS
jgi:hypothetical protein